MDLSYMLPEMILSDESTLPCSFATCECTTVSFHARMHSLVRTMKPFDLADEVIKTERPDCQQK
jgi:hypothetical protein